MALRPPLGKHRASGYVALGGHKTGHCYTRAYLRIESVLSCRRTLSGDACGAHGFHDFAYQGVACKRLLKEKAFG